MQLFFYFLIYSFGGWLLENTYNFSKSRIFLKDNFLRLPLKPMYGITPVLLLMLTKHYSNWLYVIILCFLIPSSVEYITGSLLEKYTGHKWWSYSDLSFNFNGHICLRFSCYWGFLCLVVFLILQPLLNQLYISIPSLCNWISIVLFIPFFIDLTFTLFLTLLMVQIRTCCHNVKKLEKT